MEFFSGDRQTILEYQAEVALAVDIAEEIAEEIADSAEDYYESQPTAFGLYEPGYDAEGTLPAAGLPLENVDPDAPLVAPDGSLDVGKEVAYTDISSFDTVGTGSLTLSFMRTGINVRIDPAKHILGAAQRAGVRIGANCREGMCGSCKVVKLSGQVEMNHQGGIRAREIDAGKFLPCCSTALTDLVIDA
jgi:ferredoxin